METTSNHPAILASQALPQREQLVELLHARRHHRPVQAAIHFEYSLL
jgi:hypothetical protein